MTSINGINGNVNVNLPKVKAKVNKEEAKAAAPQVKPEIQQQKADDVLNYMAGTSQVNIEKKQIGEAVVKEKKTVEVKKFVAPDQAKGIAKDMEKFQKLYAAVLQEVQANFPVSPELAQKIAAQTMEKLSA